MDNTVSQNNRSREPWNKGKLVGQKTSRPVQFEITEQSRIAVADGMKL